MSTITPNIEGTIDAIASTDLGTLRVSGWAGAAAGAPPTEVEILVNDTIKTTVVANLPRANGEENGFATIIHSPAQPAIISARTLPGVPGQSLVLGRRMMPFPVPIQVVGKPGETPPEQVATFFWVDGNGQIAKTIVSVPIHNGVALYNGEPLPNGARWAITVHDPTGLPIFRSGPLEKLPGPASGFALVTRIAAFRASTAGAFGINSPDGAPELVRQRLNLLPAPFRVDGVQLSADNAGREVVTVTGLIRFLFLSSPFSYSLPLTLRPATEPGHPEEVVIVEIGGESSATGSSLGSLAVTLNQAIVEGVSNALNAALKQIAALQFDLFGIGFPASLVSVTAIEVHPIQSDPQIFATVHAGAIIGGAGTGVFENNL